jgi:putative membrane protein
VQFSSPIHTYREWHRAGAAASLLENLFDPNNRQTPRLNLEAGVQGTMESESSAEPGAAKSQASASSNQLAQQRTDMALVRTRIAADRTLMAWIRTALSMISFGFTIYKFLQYIHQSEGVGIAVHGPRNLGVTLIALGTMALTVASIQHWQLLKSLQPASKGWQIWSWSLTIAAAISLLGLTAFVSVLWRIGPF